MAFGLKMRKFPRPEIERRVREAAEILEIQDLLGRKPRQLSGGQRQRVAVGRAIVRQPQVFLFDEPLSNLDAKLRVQMRVELKRLHARLQSTVIYVTHDQVEAMTLGDRVVVMKDGVVQQMEEPLAVYGSPTNKFVAGFIGSPAMNFIECTVTGSGSDLSLEAPDLRAAVPRERTLALAPYVGKRVTLGIRPEDIFQATQEESPDSVFSGIVEVIEPLGAEVLLDLRVGPGTMVARVPAATTVRLHEEIRLSLSPSKIHLFDLQTERAIS
jgi:multiple sugar transport system ATP-binding protein